MALPASAPMQDDMRMELVRNQVAQGIPVSQHSVPDVEIQSVPMISKIASCWCCPVLCCTCCYTVQPNEHAAVLHFGKFTHLETSAGLHFAWPAGKDVRQVTVKQQTLSLPEAKITDSNGTPVLVSAIVNYRVADVAKAMFSVEDYRSYLLNNATTVLKQVVSKNSYDNLKEHAPDLNEDMMKEVQNRVSFAGIQISSMSLNELNYAPEIAASMLRRQQAESLVDAREKIVEGAVNIAQSAIERLESGGKIKMSDADKVKIVTNLLTVTCSESDATPTVSM
eukprot:TRINITY_DN88523_c0_g1_i1.p1 TRINITY_DN88523_c0_g1~~TRINITY_DN88523_c0_g1_i1.p1  ORF type:complete len:281 (+),score=63.35 TRINITY_DN88523_c0_g1_i1:54-896(+)